MPKTKASQTYANISLALSWLAHYWCSLRRSYIAALYATLASAALSLKCAHHTHYAECMHDWNAIFGHMGGLHKRVIWWAGGVQGLLLYWKLQSNQDFKQRRNGGFIKIRTFPRCNSSFLKGSFSRVFLHFISLSLSLSLSFWVSLTLPHERFLPRCQMLYSQNTNKNINPQVISLLLYIYASSNCVALHDTVFHALTL